MTHAGTLLSLRRCAWIAVALATLGLGTAEAVGQQDAEAVARLLAQPVDVDAAEPDGSTALHWAAYADDLETTRRLLRAGANVNAANAHGVTPLSLACTNGSAAVVKTLLGAGADPNAALWSGETVLMTCARTGNAEAVTALLAAGAEVNRAEPAEHQTALMWAVSERHAAVAHVLVEHGADVTARSRRGFTPLLFAAREGDLDSARLLVNAGASPADEALNGASALVITTTRGHPALARWLLARGADPNAAGAGYTALHWASGLWETELTGPAGIETARDEEWRSLAGLPAGKLELVRALLAHGADPNARADRSPRRIGFGGRRDADGATPFFLAAMAGDLDMMRVLVEQRADPHLPNAGGMTPLMVAAGVGRRLAESSVTPARALAATQAVWELGGVDVNAASDAGDTALHGAANIGSAALVQFLVDRGAAVDVENRRGRTPLMRAAGTPAEARLRELAAEEKTAERRPGASPLPAPPLSAQAAGERAGGLRQIQPGHYVYLHTDDTPGVSSTFNSGVIVTSEGVVVIDANGSEEIARQVREAIAQVTDQPVRFLVSSTFHGRFTGGNAIYGDAYNIGHERYREDLMGLLQDAAPEDRAARLPDQTYRERVTLHLGGKEIRILHLGRAHTRGDSIVFVPADRIAYLSEVFNFDEFPYTRDSYPGDWLRTLEAAEALEADVFVPGHGFLPDDPRETRAGLHGHRQILLDVRQAVREQVERSATVDQAVANIDIPQYRRFQGYSRAMEMAVRRVHQELTTGLD